MIVILTRPMNPLIHLHDMIYTEISKALESRPQLGYVFSAISTSGGLIGYLDFTLKALSIISVMLGIVVAVYTIKLQRAKLLAHERSNTKPSDSE